MSVRQVILYVLLLLPSVSVAGTWDYIWGSTKYFFSTKEGYKTIEEMKIVDDLADCSTVADFKSLPAGSLFQIPMPIERYKLDKEYIIDVTYAPGNPDSIQKGLWKICLEPAKKENERYRYKRIGGMTSGLLVVPYKWRKKGNIFSGEATIGPYWGFRNEIFTLALTAGLSQVALKDADTQEVEYETGFSYATGFIFNVNEDFDIALVAGKDRLFGGAGEKFEHQNDWWYSFAIGYKFTK